MQVLTEENLQKELEKSAQKVPNTIRLSTVNFRVLPRTFLDKLISHFYNFTHAKKLGLLSLFSVYL